MDINHIRPPPIPSHQLIDQFLSIREIYEDIIDDFSQHEEGEADAPSFVLGNNHGNENLCDIEYFAREIDGSETAGFIEKKSDINTIDFRETHLSKYFPKFDEFCNEYSDELVFSPHVAVFFKATRSLQFSNLNPEEENKLTKQDFNRLVKEMREIFRTRKFKKTLRDREKRCDENFSSSSEYVKRLFEIYARLLVIRIDFSFGFKHSDEKPKLSPREAKAYLTKFLNAKRHNKIFKDVVGYIWKMEFGEVRGYHFHCLFFLDGSKSHKDAYRANEMGRYWKSITGGVSRFFNVNKRKRHYEKVGIGVGMISHNDHTMRNNLMRIVQYFFKKDQFLKFKYSEHDRVFGRGEMPSKRNSGIGRPRELR